MKNARISFLVSLLLLLAQGCGVSPFPADAISGSSASETTPSPVTVTAGTALGVYVLTAYDSDPENWTLWKSCEVPTGTPIGTTIPCVAQIPEGTLYFSKLKVQMVVQDEAACDIAVFKPYVYQASTSATFLPDWVSSAVDCTALPLSEDCFSGAGIDLLEYPKFDEIFYTLSGQSLSKAWSVRSAREAERFTGNRWTNNTLAVRTGNLVATPAVDGYVANTMQDWSFDCRDIYYDINYSVALTIEDIDTGGPACDPNLYTCNQFTDWDSTQATDPQ